MLVKVIFELSVLLHELFIIIWISRGLLGSLADYTFQYAQANKIKQKQAYSVPKQ